MEEHDPIREAAQITEVLSSHTSLGFNIKTTYDLALCKLHSHYVVFLFPAA